MRVSPALAGMVLTLFVFETAAVVVMRNENRHMRLELDGVRAANAMQVPLPPPEQACAAWLFSTDLKAAKARICKRP